MSIKKSLIAAVAFAFAGSALAADPPPYPRLGGINIGAPFNYGDAAYQAKLAKLHVSVVTMWPGWGGSWNTTAEEAVREIKALNPNTKIFLYHNSMEANDNESVQAVLDKVNQMHWWAYASGTGGTRVKSPFGARTNKATYSINITDFSPRDSSGYAWWEWDVRWTINNLYKPAPSIDGFYEDNVYWRPLVDADWNRDGVIDSKTNATAGTWLRQGYRKRFDLMKQLMPGRYQLGNITAWGEKDAVITEYQGMLHGGIMEGLIGTNYAPETWSTWAEMMRQYRKMIGALAQPKLAIFGAQGAATDYKMARYALTSCLMDDAYFSYKDPAKGYTGVIWFDEYDSNLGAAISPPPTAAWQNGVWRRDFENGIAIVNPKGNGTRTITLEEDFQRLKGAQAPSVNSGATARTVTLTERDGIILKRIKPKAPPSAPTLMTVH